MISANYLLRLSPALNHLLVCVLPWFSTLGHLAVVEGGVSQLSAHEDLCAFSFTAGTWCSQFWAPKRSVVGE